MSAFVLLISLLQYAADLSCEFPDIRFTGLFTDDIKYVVQRLPEPGQVLVVERVFLASPQNVRKLPGLLSGGPFPVNLFCQLALTVVQAPGQKDGQRRLLNRGPFERGDIQPEVYLAFFQAHVRRRHGEGPEVVRTLHELDLTDNIGHGQAPCVVGDILHERLQLFKERGKPAPSPDTRRVDHVDAVLCVMPDNNGCLPGLLLGGPALSERHDGRVLELGQSGAQRQTAPLHGLKNRPPRPPAVFTLEDILQGRGIRSGFPSPFY